MMRPQMAKSLLRRRAPCTQNNIIRSFGTASLLKSRIVRNENEMQELGAQFAAVSKAGDVVFLQG
jgi:protein-tyrosine-phosphatase